MRVVVTGGTGFVGRALVGQLLDDGAEVVVLTRDPSRTAGSLPVRAKLHAWDPQQPLDPAQLDGADAIVNLAGEGIADGRWTAERKRAIRDSRVLGTRALVNAMAPLDAGKRPRALISASAIGYYGDRGDELLAERSDAGTGFLADVCREWEAEAVAAESLSVRVARIRIGVVLGRDGGALAKMLPPFRLGAGGRVGSGKQWMSWVHRDDLVSMMLWALKNDSARGAFNATAPGPVRNADFTKALAHALHRPAILPVPAQALRVALGEMASVLLASQRVLPQEALRGGFQFRFGDVETALRDICADLDHELVYEQWIPAPVDRVFDFFSDAHNLERITPAFLQFNVLGTTTDKLQEGTRIDYRLKLRGIPVRWQSAIESWDPPRSFRDRQTRGPYARWIHKHEFESYEGGTIVRDRIRYAVPVGALGELAGGAWVARDVKKIFEFRRAVLARMFSDQRETALRSQEQTVVQAG
jgi:uncharacterized protein (TIGR01777 family)